MEQVILEDEDGTVLKTYYSPSDTRQTAKSRLQIRDRRPPLRDRPPLLDRPQISEEMWEATRKVRMMIDGQSGAVFQSTLSPDDNFHPSVPES